MAGQLQLARRSQERRRIHEPFGRRRRNISSLMLKYEVILLITYYFNISEEMLEGIVKTSIIKKSIENEYILGIICFVIVTHKVLTLVCHYNKTYDAQAVSTLDYINYTKKSKNQ